MDLILYILTVMIFWDLSLHLIELMGKARKFTSSQSIFSYYYPHFRWIKTPKGPVERKNWYRFYQVFWVAYWSFAFALILVYIIFH